VINFKRPALLTVSQRPASVDDPPPSSRLCLKYLCMKRLTQFTAILLAAHSLKAQENPATSLRDPQTARPLKSSEIQRFGPKSGQFRYDARLIRAAEIAAARACKTSTRRCWRSVKNALLAAEAIDTRPDTVFAKQAALELVAEYGFRKLAVKSPYDAPIGAVLVYGGRGAGHVEFRTRNGFVSDFFATKPSSRPFLGAFVKPAS
jgi:hypothetical protein